MPGKYPGQTGPLWWSIGLGHLGTGSFSSGRYRNLKQNFHKFLMGKFAVIFF